MYLTLRQQLDNSLYLLKKSKSLHASTATKKRKEIMYTSKIYYAHLLLSTEIKLPALHKMEIKLSQILF